MASAAAESAAESATNVPQQPLKRDRKKAFNQRQGSFGSPPSSERPTEVFPHVDILSEGFRRRLRHRCQTPPPSGVHHQHAQRKTLHAPVPLLFG